MNRYSLVFLFNYAADKVLLILKDHGPYTGCWNGVGGKIDDGEKPLSGAVREVKEETDVSIGACIKQFVVCSYPSGTRLYVYYAQTEESEPRQMESEPVLWFDVERVIKDRDLTVAGEGNTRYFVEAAWTAIMEARNAKH